MRKENTLLIKLVSLFVLIMAAGTVGYTLIEKGWSLFDGFYMTLITLTTIGFGEVHDLTPAGRLFTILIIVTGMGVAATVMGQFARILIEENLSANWRKHRMAKQISRMKHHVIVCGFGRIGKAITRELLGMGIPCVVIDKDEDRSDHSRDENLPTVHGNATNDETLITAGIDRAAILVAALSNDSDNLFVALAARDLNRNLRVIARGEDRSIETRMLRAGVDRVVYPSQLGGNQIARLVGQELGQDNESDMSRRLTDVLGYDLQVYRNFRDKAVTVSEIIAATGALEVAAHIDKDGRRFNRPDADHSIGPEETAVLLVEMASAPRLESCGLPQGFEMDDLSVGIPALDEEHLGLLELIQKVQDLDNTRASRKQLKSILTDLMDYVNRHFHHEEQLMAATDYPDMEAHVRKHRILTEQVSQMVMEADHLAPVNLAEILNSWLVDHIMDEDHAYMEHLGGVKV